MTTDSLWRNRSFLSLWTSQFFSALNDNLFRYALITALVFNVIPMDHDIAKIWATLSAGIFILPYLLLSGLAGTLADRYAKSRLLRWSRAIEILMFGFAGYALHSGNTALLMTSLLLIGFMAAMYGPVKHAITPEFLPPHKLIAANGAIESSTYIAILLGTLIGSSLVIAPDGLDYVVWLMLAIAAISWLSSLFTAHTTPAAPHLKHDLNFLRQTWGLLTWGTAEKTRLRLLLGHAWFWFVGAAVLTQIPILVKDDLNVDPAVNTLLLGVFGIGIALGSWLCNRLSRGQVTANFVPLAALGMAASSLALAAVTYLTPAYPIAIGITAFLHSASGIVISLLMMALAACGGLYVVPLVSLLQVTAAVDARARMQAAANIWFALFVIVASLLCTAIMALGGTAQTVFAVVGVMTLAVAIYITRRLPTETVKGCFTALFRLFFKVEVTGLENLAAVGPRAVIICNHQSYLDGALLAAFLPGRPMFAVDKTVATRWWAKPFLNLIEVFAINPAQPFQTKGLIRAVQQNRHCVIFPEGRLTTTGAIMKVNAGPVMIANKADAPIVPVIIDGLQFTPFGRLKTLLPVRLAGKITIHVLPPLRIAPHDNLFGRHKRQAMAQELYDIMTEAQVKTQSLPPNLWQALQQASRTYGAAAPMLEDPARKPMSYRRLLAAALALSQPIARQTARGDMVGLLLPTGIGGTVTFFALQAMGRVPALLNFSSGAGNLRAAITAAQIKTIYTAREFIEHGKLNQLLVDIGGDCTIVYLEDLRKTITWLDKINALVMARFGIAPRVGRAAQPDDPAVVLFTSGSEGVPKGVVLSHQNILSNCSQLRRVLEFTPRDSVFNALPMFHSFGLTGGVLLPVLYGVKTFLYPTPLHYRLIPELVYQSSATIMFGTDTFLAGYAKTAEPYDFSRLRGVFAGAERVKPATRAIYSDKYSVPIFEGYGVTECAPVIAVNTPMFHQAGTVGRILPGIDYKLEAVHGISDGKKLWVRGPNIMLGYLRAAQPGVIEPLADGWYGTGDIVTLDAAGFVTIVGRVKRFAKIGGEMISLAVVEDSANQLWPGSVNAAVSVPDTRKGEAIVLVSTHAAATAATLAQAMRIQGLPELAMPKTIIVQAELPVLGSGKIDYVRLAERVIAEQSHN